MPKSHLPGRVAMERTLEKEPNWAELSNGALARRFGIHRRTAQAARATLERGGLIPNVTTRRSMDGKTYHLDALLLPNAMRATSAQR
jgi:hypothetical protein